MTKKKISKKPWTKKEYYSVLQGIGANSIAWLCKKAGNRSYGAVIAKLNRDSGLGGLTRGSYTLASMVRLTGYNVSQLKRAQRALRQKWKKTSKNGYYLITEEQLEEIVAWLGLDYWSKPHRLYKCLWCHTRTEHHRAYGLCDVCYPKYERWIASLKIKRNLESVKGYIERSLLSQNEKERAMKSLNMRRALPLDMLGKL